MSVWEIFCVYGFTTPGVIEVSLPPLQGTPKQMEWAERIRAEHVPKILHFFRAHVFDERIKGFRTDERTAQRYEEGTQSPSSQATNGCASGLG